MAKARSRSPPVPSITAAGRLSSAETLNLLAAQVTNSNAGSIGSQGALTASVTGLDQQSGKLFSNTRLSLDLNHGQLNNINGVISAPGTLLLKQLNGVNNQGGDDFQRRSVHPER